MKLIDLLILLGILMVFNQKVCAQNETVGYLPADGNMNIARNNSKEAVEDANQDDLCLVLAPIQTGAKSYILNSLPPDPQNRIETKEFYLKRSKNQKNTAWILLGGGTALAIIGVIGFEQNFDVWGDNDSYTRTDIFGFVLLTGIVADLVSIPFFISSSHNKKVASSLSFGNQPIYAPMGKSYSLNVRPTMTLRIPF